MFAKTALLALAASLAATVAQAGDVKPMAAKTVELEGAVGTVYFTKEAEGMRIVATVGAVESLKPIRFVAVLSDGQSMTISVPRDADKESQEIAIVRNGDSISVDAVEPNMVRASLD